MWKIALTVTALATLSRAAAAENVLRTERGAVVHWETNELSIAVDPNAASKHLGAEKVVAALDAALEEWNALAEVPTRLARAITRPAAWVRFCSGGWKGAEGQLAHTEFQADVATGIVRAAVIEVNECDFRFVGPDDVAPHTFDLQSVLTHELGHMLGLGHSADPRAVMFTSTGSTRQRRPTADDRAGLAVIAKTWRAPLPAPASVALTATTAPGASARARSLPPPRDALAGVRVQGKTSAAMVYTCEPTILPAIETAPRKTPPRRPRPKRTPIALEPPP